IDEILPPSSELSFDAIEGTSEYSSHNNDVETPPPPSPVSSSYSELRRATDVFKQPYINCCTKSHETNISCNDSGSNNKGLRGFQPQTYINVSCNNEFKIYCATMQGSTTYESIYEPIIPRPASQLSSHANYLNYVPYVNGPQLDTSESGGNVSTIGSISTIGCNTPSYPSVDAVAANANSKSSCQQKEVEVEALTDFLVHSLDTGNGVENYGTCFKCNERVVGENSGCTAMEQIYHIACFTCTQCKINLQGKPFYALDGKPLCEYDYLQTLEKCSVCLKPILERILRATGKPYHPQCFTCIICGHSLDGIPFTVDATNQNYCISDFHKKFAPRCCVCLEPIMPETGEEETVRVVALDRSFHFGCYKCEDCGLLLSSEAEGRGCYPLDGHVLCKSCNAKRVQMLTSRMATEL
ncbi:lipoma-preferred partner homolog, partial [Anastrepha ludens]|uniref:lipoma-preferred partner homolog n=2 Tax=Anastrepha ludens TaxID=28586 RepID=UPI0023AF0EB8